MTMSGANVTIAGNLTVTGTTEGDGNIILVMAQLIQLRLMLQFKVVYSLKVLLVIVSKLH